MKSWIIIFLAAIMIGLAIYPFTSLGQPSEQQAYQAFVDAGCTACHNGGAAPDWNGTVATIIEWAQNYNNIDDAVSSEYGADTYDDMMEQMRQYTPGITQEQYDILYNFFLELFNYYSQQQTTTTPPETTTSPTANTTTVPEQTTQCNATTTITETITETITKTKTKTVTETLTKYQDRTITKMQNIEREKPEARERPPTAAYAPIIATILVLLVLAYIIVQSR